MTYQTRRHFYRQLEAERDSKIIAYVTGDRPGLETSIAAEALDIFADHLDAMGVVDRISLVLYTLGGDPHAARSIANLIATFCDEFEVIVPSKCRSAGTLLCLGADTIVMTKQATLGPIDPSVNTSLNPVVPGMGFGNAVPVSVEDVNAFIEQARVALPNQPIDKVFDRLAKSVHPLVLGKAFRTRAQIRMLGDRLLSTHMNDREAVNRTLDFLCSDAGSHDYTINRREASTDLGLPVVHPSWVEYTAIRSLLMDFAQELELTTPLDPAEVLANSSEASYSFTCGLIESLDLGAHAVKIDGTLRVLRTTLEDGRIEDRLVDQRKPKVWRSIDGK